MGPDEGMALCLSGGGYRAMLFHVGALWRLNEVGYLRNIRRISSVSGGSIAAGALGLAWDRLGFDGNDVAAEFTAEFVEPIRKLAGRSVDWRAIAAGLLAPGSVNHRLARAYRRHLFGKATLQDLPGPDGPRFVINATNLQSGVLWRFSRPYSWDYKVGKIANPKISLADAVAASSAFPPFLSPARFRFSHDDFLPSTGDGLQRPPFTTRPVLSDGGVYDNLGLETAWKRCQTVLISDGGGAMTAEEGRLGPLGWWRWRGWGSQMLRVLFTVDNQVRNLRKRQALAAFESSGSDRRDGTYWGIRSDISAYHLPSSLPCPIGKTQELANIPTGLRKLDRVTQERLINWGYGVCDAAIRRWVDSSLSEPAGFPYPDSGVGGTAGR
jgi:NTE family protein